MLLHKLNRRATLPTAPSSSLDDDLMYVDDLMQNGVLRHFTERFDFYPNSPLCDHHLHSSLIDVRPCLKLFVGSHTLDACSVILHQHWIDVVLCPSRVPERYLYYLRLKSHLWLSAAHRFSLVLGFDGRPSQTARLMA